MPMDIDGNLLKKRKIFDQFDDVETDKQHKTETKKHTVRVPVQKQLNKPLRTYLDLETYEKFCACCEESGLKPATVARQLIIKYIKEHA